MSEDWEEETKSIRKLSAKKRHVAKPKLPTKRPKQSIGEIRLPYHASTHLPPLVCGQFVGVDGTRAKKLKRGDLPIEATLDLHGMTQEEALKALTKTLARAHASGLCVLRVVTGKGREDGGGVLRKALPAWLNLPEIRPHILTFTHATPAQGSTGAFILLLRRKSLE
jgi:DNA-nicking Smr family endonuclease